MADAIASLFVKIGADASGLKKALGETKTGLDQARKQVGNTTADLKGLVTSFGAIAAGAAAFGYAAKQIYDFGKAGAELDYTRQKFDRLSQSMGVTSDAMMKDLRAATKGTMSDLQLAAGAGDLMALGLANSRQEALRLTKVVGGLGMNMNQLVLTLTNQTTMRFDQLGVSVDGFDEKVNKLKESGMSASDAFQEAFLQQAEEQLEKIGNKADTAAGAAMRLEASWANFANTAKTDVVPAFSATVTGLQAVLDAMTQASNMQAEADAVTWTGYGKQAGAILKREARAILEARKDVDMSFTYDTTTGAAKAVQEYNASLAKRYSATNTQVKQMGSLSFAEARNAFMVEQTTRKMDELSLFMQGPVGKSNKNYSNQMKDLRKQLLQAGEAVKKLQATPWKKEELGQAQTTYKEVQVQIQQTTDDQKKQGRELLFNMAQAELSMNGLTKEEANFLTELAAQYGLIDEETKNMYDDMKLPLDDFEAGLKTEKEMLKVMETLATNWDVHIYYHEHGEPLPTGGGGGKGPKQVKNTTPGTKPKAEGFADGGIYMRGKPRLVGERGPELEIPTSSGQIISNEELRKLFGAGAGGGSQVVQNINVNLAVPASGYTATQFMREIQRLGGVR